MFVRELLFGSVTHDGENSADGGLQPEGRWSSRTISSKRSTAVKVRAGPCQVIARRSLSRPASVLRAALDVFENEPQVHPGLLANPDVVSFAENTSPLEMPYGESFSVFRAALNRLFDRIDAPPHLITIRHPQGQETAALTRSRRSRLTVLRGSTSRVCTASSRWSTTSSRSSRRADPTRP
jgi:hypothetical protein